MKFLYLIAFAVLVACTALPTGSANDQAIAAGVASYNSLNAAMLASDAAIKTNLLKGNDAVKVVTAAATAKAALDAMLAALRVANAAPAASGVAK